MYNRQLKNRRERMIAFVTGSNPSNQVMPVPQIFGASFLDNFRIDYEPQYFADIDFGTQKDLPRWERLTAS